MKTIDKKSPIVIGGLGGSGTRVIAEICQHIGIFLGYNLTDALDNLWYTALFKRKNLFEVEKKEREIQIKKGLDILTNAMVRDQLNSDVLHRRLMEYAHNLKRDAYFSNEFEHYFQSVTNFIQNILKESKLDPRFFYGWGWKEPNSHILLKYLAGYYDNLRYIHVVRHGLDMAFSNNQTQAKFWGPMYGIFYSDQDIDPIASFNYWVEANKKAVRVGNTLLKDRFLLLRLEDLCIFADSEIKRLINFLDFPVSGEKIEFVRKIPRLPKTVGRYKDHDTSWVENNHIESLMSFGYTYC